MRQKARVKMAGEIVVAAISFFGTCVGSWGGLRLMSYRIEQLEKKVEKHNNFAGRMPVVEEQIKELQKDVEEIKKG